MLPSLNSDVCFVTPSAAVQGEDYVLDAAAPEIQFLSAARGLKRKFSVQVHTAPPQRCCWHVSAA